MKLCEILESFDEPTPATKVELRKTANALQYVYHMLDTRLNDLFFNGILMFSRNTKRVIRVNVIERDGTPGFREWNVSDNISDIKFNEIKKLTTKWAQAFSRRNSFENAHINDLYESFEEPREEMVADIIRKKMALEYNLQRYNKIIDSFFDNDVLSTYKINVPHEVSIPISYMDDKGDQKTYTWFMRGQVGHTDRIQKLVNKYFRAMSALNQFRLDYKQHLK